MSVGFSRVSEESVRNPDFTDHVAVEHEHFHGAVEFQSAIKPGLGKNYIYRVFLREKKRVKTHDSKASILDVLFKSLDFYTLKFL